MKNKKYKINPFTGRLDRINSSENGNGGVSNLPDLNDVEFDSGTPTDGQVLTYDSGSGKWKAEDSAGGGGTSGARVRATRESFQMISDDSDTKIEFDVEQWDLYEEFSDGTFTVTETGYYHITANACFLSSKAVFLIAISIKVNDSYRNSNYVSTNALYDIGSIRTSDTVYLEIGDTVTIEVHQDSGAPTILLGVDSPLITSVAINKL